MHLQILHSKMYFSIVLPYIPRPSSFVPDWDLIEEIVI